MALPAPHLRMVGPPAADPGDVTDAVLVARAAAGDAGAHEAIFRRHAAIVLNLATVLLRDRVDAEDVLQETFEIVFARLRQLRDPEALRAWLLRIVVRQARLRLRRGAWRFWAGRPAEPESPASLESCASPDASPEQRAELALLDHSLGQLAPPEREAWILRHVEGLQLEEVAEACACSLATAKRRIARADAFVRRRVALAEKEGTDADRP